MGPLPELILNRAFMVDFSETQEASFAMGLVEADEQKTGFLVMRPDNQIPPEMLALGMAFGHRVFEFQNELICQFVFSVYGHKKYSVLVNPTDPMVQKVLEMMIERKDYFFFILNPDGRASAFRSDLGEDNLVGLQGSLPKIQTSNTPQDIFDAASESFREAPDREVPVLTWVCRNNLSYLDLDTDPMVLPPAR